MSVPKRIKFQYWLLGFLTPVVVFVIMIWFSYHESFGATIKKFYYFFLFFFPLLMSLNAVALYVEKKTNEIVNELTKKYWTWIVWGVVSFFFFLIFLICVLPLISILLFS